MKISDFDFVNPGDRLVVKCDLRYRQVYNNQTVMSDMTGLAGCTVTVREILRSSSLERGYDIRIEEDTWWWSPGMFQSIDNSGNVSLSDYLY